MGGFLDFARHKAKNLALLWLSLIFLPIDTAVIFCISLWSTFFLKRRHHGDASTPRSQKTILITGVSMSKGLALARLFHNAGHKVIGADFHSLSLGNASNAIHRFHKLPHPRTTPFSSDDDIEDDPYALELLRIVKEHGVDLWISVSDVAAAIQDALAKDMIEAQTYAKAIQLSAQYVRTLDDKSSFIQYAKHHELPTPDTEIVINRAAIISFLNQRGGLQAKDGAKRYLLKPIGVNDIARNDMPLLPLGTEEDTMRCINKIDLNDGDKFIMQEYLEGREFCTHALVIRGQVRAFVACPSSGLLMHYEALPPGSHLSRFMLTFTETIAEAEGENFTGHVSFDFMAKSGDSWDAKAGDVLMCPIECNPRVHTAIVLFNDTPELVREYLSILDDAPQQDGAHSVITPRNPKRYYWVGQDLVERFIIPLFGGLLSDPRDVRYAGEVGSFLEHVKNWKDGTFEISDPWPWWWLYHVYWPSQFLGYLIWGRWNKLNVSTGKAFQAS